MNNKIMDDIIGRMNENKKKEKVNVEDSLLAKTSKDGYDYYAILGFSSIPISERSKIPLRDIKNEYTKKLRKYHPQYRDKNLSKEECKTMDTMFRLVQISAEILTNKEKRIAYDLETISKKTSGFINQKNSFDNYIKLQDKSEQSKARAKLDFDLSLKELNEKHKSFKDKPDEAFETNRKLDDLRQQRDIDEIELKPKNIFNDKFNQINFNKIFEKKRLKENKKNGSKINKDNELIAYQDIDAFEGSSGFFAGINDVDNDKNFSGNHLFSKIEFGEQGMEIDRDRDRDGDSDSDSISSGDIDINKFGNCKFDNSKIEESFAKMMESRKSNDSLYDEKGFDGYKSSINDKFGPSSGLGFMVGTSLGGNSNQIKQISTDDIDAYKNLIGYESDDLEIDF